MSLDYMKAVWESSASRLADRLVLLSIADHCDQNGQAFPSIRRLAERTGLSERTIQDSLRELVRLSELEIQPNAGPRGANFYTIRIPLPENPSGSLPEIQRPLPEKQRSLPENSALRKVCTPQSTASLPENGASLPEIHDTATGKDCTQTVITIKELSERSLSASARWFPESLRDEVFIRKWEEWEDHLRTRNRALTDQSRRGQLCECERHGIVKAIETINLAFTRNWMTLAFDYQPREKHANPTNPSGAPLSAHNNNANRNAVQDYR